MPVGDIEVGLIALHMQFATLRASHHYIHAIDISLCAVKVQWSNLRRDGHTNVIRIDSRQRIYPYRILHFTGTSQNT
jgi:methylase of polypeptide subunit release factors